MSKAVTGYAFHRPLLSRFRAYLSLVKPGIIAGNIVSATGGFLLASQGKPDIALLLFTITGIALVIGSACVYNNVIDIDIDKKMERTRSRALVRRQISKDSAVLFGALLGITGFVLLGLFTNALTLGIALFGFFTYVVLYSFIFKRATIHGTLVGSISGATPPIMGYVAAVGHFDIATILIFLAFCFWQMPHSYAIGIYLKKDFEASQIPLLPLVRGTFITRRHISLYIAAFMACIIGLGYFGYISHITTFIISAACLFWLHQALIQYQPRNSEFNEIRWGKRLFLSSIIVITMFSILMSVDHLVSLEERPTGLFKESAK